MEGGQIDRQTPLRFEFNRRQYKGFEGDTLASALVASGVSVFGRSFKYHRPRGIYARGCGEPNALMQIGTGGVSIPNVPATDIPLTNGLIARSVNAWPSLSFDLGEINDVLRQFFIAGFYYKTLMWPNWRFFEPFIRRAAGIGHAPDAPDPERYEARTLHCDVLVVGAGAAGLSAAQSARSFGADVAIVEQDAIAGGWLAWSGEKCGGRSGAEWTRDTAREICGEDGVRLLTRTMAVGYYDDNFLLAIQKTSAGSRIRERLWRIKAKSVVLAQGATHCSIPFENNDRPGIICADAFLELINRYSVAFGRRILFFVNGNIANDAVRAARDAGLEIAAIVDPSEESAAANDDRLSGHVLRRAIGRMRVCGAEIAGLDGGGARRIDCDSIVVAGGYSPQLQLLAQAGGTSRYDGARSVLTPQSSRQNVRICGACRGATTVDMGIEDGKWAGMDAAASIGFGETPPRKSLFGPARKPIAHVPGAREKTSFVDLQSDVTVADLRLAHTENLQSIDHIKRYTTLGMGVDQGKISGPAAVEAIGNIQGRSEDRIGVIKSRPPYAPVSIAALATGRKCGPLFDPQYRLPAHQWHSEKGAVFEDYGWLRPRYYQSNGETLEAAAAAEAKAVRNGVGLFDGSPLGKFEVKGPDAAAFLSLFYVGRIDTLRERRIRYGLMLNENGSIFDDGVVIRLGLDHFLVNTSSGHADAVSDWFEAWRQLEWPMDVVVQDCTAQWAVATLAGPHARDVLAALNTGIDLSKDAFPHLSFREGCMAGMPVRVQRVSFSGELGYEVNISADYGEWLMRRIEEVGAAFGLTPYGVEALDILRVEKGYIHVGADTDSETQPHDIGFPAPSPKKDSDFIGRRSLLRPASTCANRRQLVGIQSSDPACVIPMGAHLVEGAARRSIGFVTSSFHSPNLNRPVALALVNGGRRRVGQTITAWSAGQTFSATVCDPIFFDPEGERLHA